MNIYKKGAISGLFLLASGLMVGCGDGGGEPQDVQEEESFQHDVELLNWEMESSEPSVGWAFEDTTVHNPLHPEGVGEELPFVEGTWLTYTLNYNRLFWLDPEFAQPPHQINYDTPGRKNKGTATSIKIEVGELVQPRLVYWCLFDMQNDPSLDVRTVTILNADTGLLHDFARMGVDDVATAPEASCSAARQWHTHSIDLNPTWGNIRVQFAFDTWDANANEGKGWFLDDIRIQAPRRVIRLEAR